MSVGVSSVAVAFALAGCLAAVGGCAAAAAAAAVAAVFTR